MTPAEARAAAVACEQRIQRLSALADKLARAYHLLDSIGPNIEQEMPAELNATVAASRARTWEAVRITEAQIKVLRAEKERLVTIASGSAP